MDNFEIKKSGNNLILKNLPDFDLRHIFDCGQCFRFNKIDENTYFGIAYNKALKIAQNNDEVILYETSEEDFYNIWYNYFDLGCDYGKIKKTLNVDEYMQQATAYGSGIRILNQELWETVISFIISASNNIPRIKGIIEKLCSNFGDKITYMGNDYYSFPPPQKIASLSLKELDIIKAGFRDKYILSTAKEIASGEVSLEYISSLPTVDAKKELLKLKGIGNKVSDCILLFGMGRFDSFPVDVWIKRIMEYCYFENEVSITEISNLASQKFGELGGYAQQYLFFWARDNKIGIE